MLTLLLSVAWAQPAESFEPFPADTRFSGKLYQGILVDEETYIELGRLRTEVQAQRGELVAFEEWRETQVPLFEKTLMAVREEHLLGQAKLQEHYEKELDAARRQDAFQRHAFPIGLSVGVVSTVALTIVTLNMYDSMLPDSLVAR